ncbi:S-adenosylmethionine-dependent methyltransferase Rv2258c-like [Argopecten irradians]|uniref:S-adenosylmethionine-dependent methyltransferase Rv2258c-like n=1 Tax=Argopecten irradians TaxID=31199 RepID=UPI00371072A7
MDLETYSKNIIDFIAGSYITSAITLGKDLGLFEELKRLDKPVTSQQLADACKLKERYVREWLGCMVSTKIVSMDGSDKYFIPEKLKPGLGGTEFAFMFPILGTLTAKSKACFKKDGPKGYTLADELPETFDVLDARMTNTDTVVEQLFTPVKKLTKTVTTVLDLGSGVGCVTRALRRHFPDADIYGVDYSDIATTKAIAAAEAEGVKNIKFIKEDATSLPADWTGKFDWVILFDLLHDLPDQESVMKEVKRVLKDDGAVSITDPDIHSSHIDNVGDDSVAAVGYAISTVSCLPRSLSKDSSPGYGVGWGTENKEAFLTKVGWLIKDKHHIGSPLACNFTCIKA